MSDNAIQLDNEIVKEGHILKVYNKRTKKFSHENKFYYCIWVQKNDKEFPILLTEFELNRAIKRAERNPEDIPKKNFLVDIVD